MIQSRWRSARIRRCWSLRSRRARRRSWTTCAPPAGPRSGARPSGRPHGRGRSAGRTTRQHHAPTARGHARAATACRWRSPLGSDEPGPVELPLSLTIGAWLLRDALGPNCGATGWSVGPDRRTGCADVARRRTSAAGCSSWATAAPGAAPPPRATSTSAPRRSTRRSRTALAHRRDRPGCRSSIAVGELLAAGARAWDAVAHRLLDGGLVGRRAALRRRARTASGTSSRRGRAVTDPAGSSRSSGRRRPASPTSPSRSPQRLDGEVINADSMQLYARHGHRHGEAAAGRARRRRRTTCSTSGRSASPPRSPSTSSSPARAIAAIHARGRVPVLVGGSGLYLRGALDHLEFPGESPAIRAPARTPSSPTSGPRRCTRGSPSATRLAAAAILPSNGRRIVRALEVIELTGRPFTARMPGFESVYDTGSVGLDRADLDERVDAAGARDDGARAARRGPRACCRAGCATARPRARRSATRSCSPCSTTTGDLVGDLDEAIAADGRAPRAGSSGGSGPGSAATRASAGWTRPTRSARPRPGRACRLRWSGDGR